MKKYPRNLPRLPAQNSPSLASPLALAGPELLENRRLLSTGALPALGVNLEGLSPNARSLMFVDAMKTSLHFGSVKSPWDQSAPVDANGWPTQDAGVEVFTMGTSILPQEDIPDVSGDYHLSFSGVGKVGLVSTKGTVTNQQYNAATNTTTADVILNAGANQLYLDFTGTNHGVQNVQLIRPGYAANTTQIFTTPFLSQIAPFQTLRFVDFLDSNHNNSVNWSDRTPVTYAQQTGVNGGAWEYAIDLANETGKNLWINIPVKATDDYVRNLAELFKSELNPGIKLYMEYGNELWNNTFTFGAQYNSSQALAEAQADPSLLAYDGTTSIYTLAARRVAERIVEISNDFASVYGPGAMNSLINPVLAGQMANPSRVRDQLQFIQHAYGAPDQYIQALAGAAYVHLDSQQQNNPNLSEDDIINLAQENMAWVGPAVEKFSTMAAYYNLQNFGYEGGFQIIGSASLKAKIAANLDPRYGQLMQTYLSTVYASGMDMLLYYQLANHYSWQNIEGLTENIFDGSVKTRALDVFASTPAPALSIGTSVSAGDSKTLSASAYNADIYEQPGDGSSNLTAKNSDQVFDYLVVTPDYGPLSLTLTAGSIVTSGQVQVYWDSNLVATLNLADTGSLNSYLASRTVLLNVTQSGDGIMHTLRLELLGNTKYAAYTVHDLKLAAAPLVAAPPPRPAVHANDQIGAINLTWDEDSTSVTGFQLERSTDGVNFSILAILPANAASYRDAQVQSGKMYYYRMLALNLAVSSSYSFTVGASDTDYGSLFVPANLWASQTDPNHIQLNWGAPAQDGETFRVQYSTDGQHFTTAGAAASGATSFLESESLPDTLYFLRIEAIDANGDATFSNAVTVNTHAVTWQG